MRSRRCGLRGRLVEFWEVGRAARAHRAWRRALLPLVVRRTRALRAAHHEGKQRLGVATHTALMVSSMAKPCGRRTMGCEVAFADVVLRAEVADIGVDDGVHVAEGVREADEARVGVRPELGRREDLKLDVARVPAETAVGFAPEGIVEAGFGEREQQREVIASALAGGRGAAAAGHRDDDQRPEADDQSHEGGDVSQQPQREARAFHGRQYTAVGGPAGLVCRNPPNSRRKCLRSFGMQKS